MSDPQLETRRSASPWRVRPLLVVVLALTVGATHAVPAPAEHAPDALAQARRRHHARQEFAEEQDRRVAAVEEERTRLGRDHAWAGKYVASEYIAPFVALWIAPDAGFVVRSCTCFGCDRASFGRVVEDQHGDLRLVFEAPNGTQQQPWFPDVLETTCQQGARQVVGVGRRFELEPLIDVAQRD